MYFIDRLTLDAPKRTKDGYMAVRAKAARTGVYAYLGSEIDPKNEHGLRDAGTVHVLRDEQTVFDEASARSFIGKPITDDHPKDPVTADNWTDHARGMIMGAMRNGDYLAFDLLLTDAATIKKVDDGKRELSNGYATDLEFGDFEAPDGTKCAARQVKISGNHIAVVDKGRAGSECCIADAASCEPMPRAMLADLAAHLLDSERTYADPAQNDKKPSTNAGRQSGDFKMPHTLMIDGLQVPNVSDEAKAAIEKLQGQISTLTADKAAVETKVGELTATIATKDGELATKDGEIAGLNKKLEDSAVKPEQLEQMAADRAALISQAKAIAPSIVTDGKSDAEIRKAAVEASLGDAAKDMDDNHIAGAFKALAKDAKPDPLRKTIAAGVKSVGDGKAAVEDRRRLWLDSKESAYRGNPVEA